MSEPSPAELLREAANHMRRSAEGAIAEDLHRGRWQAKEFGSPDGCPFYVQGDESRLILAQFLREREATYVAGMDPATALAVADWLDAEARWYDAQPIATQRVIAGSPTQAPAQALVVARTYLRRKPVKVVER